MYRPIQIADYLLSKYGREGRITPQKLIKLVYLAHGWHLAVTDRPLIDENPEAWKYGPIIPSLYQKYKSYRNTPIPWKGMSVPATDAELEEFLDRIWEVYGQFDGIQLSAQTHQPDSPWARVWNGVKSGEYISLQIPERFIAEHYHYLLAKNERRARMQEHEEAV